MTSPAYAPAPVYDAEKYRRAKASLADPSLPADSRAIREARVAEFEKSQAEEDQARGYAHTSTLDPVKEELVKKIRLATRDDTLPNASGLKVYSSPPEFEAPNKPVVNPFNSLGGLGYQGYSAGNGVSDKWHEPTVKDFRAALAAGGPLAEHTKAELGRGAYGSDNVPEPVVGPNEHSPRRVKDITQLGNEPIDPEKLDDATLESSDAFKVYRDAAWQHALADAVAQNRPLYRVAFTKKLSDLEKTMAGVQDTAGAGVGGALQSSTLGLMDPIQRSISPAWAEENRKQRNRHPTAETVGEVAGAFTGAPEAVARGSAEAIGKKLGSGPMAKLATSAGAGAITGGVDAQTRAIAQSAADALDAQESAVEAAKRIYDALSPRTALGGAAMGAGAGVAGHAIGSTLGAGARRLVTSGEGDAGRAATIRQNLDTGGKLDWKGQIRTEPEIENLRHAAPHDMPADEILARKAADPMLKQRRLEQEAAHRSADEVTSAARERLGGQTVPVEDTANRLDEYASGLVDDTAASEVRKLARKLRKASLLSPEELDSYIENMDQKAGYDSGRKLDKKRAHFVEAGRILREDRDSLRFDEPTNAGGFALRDSRGNVKSNTDYSAVKTELSDKQHKLNEENVDLGLPKELPVAPQRLSPAPDDLSRDALAEGTEPNVRLEPDQEKTFLRGLQDVGVPGKSIETKAKMRLAERSGVSRELDLVRKMRARKDYRTLLAQGMSGISAGPGGVGNKFLSSNQLLRAVPTLHSFSGGLPKMEATDALVDLVDRHLAEQSGHGRGITGERILGEMVPEAKALNLRGGQPAKFIGAATHNEKGDAAKLTPEETALARSIIRNLLQQQAQ